MSRAYQSFEHGIKDAEELLAHFDDLNTNPPPQNAEVLKRAGLVMALTAWETYVEDRLLEEMNKKLDAVAGSYVGDFVLKKLQADLKQFNNPSSDKTKRIFQDYLGLDVTNGWTWANYDPERASRLLKYSPTSLPSCRLAKTIEAHPTDEIEERATHARSRHLHREPVHHAPPR